MTPENFKLATLEEFQILGGENENLTDTVSVKMYCEYDQSHTDAVECYWSDTLIVEFMEAGEVLK